MSFLDSRSYKDNRRMWKHQGKSDKWLKGYDAAWEGKPSPPVTASDEYVEGYKFGFNDLQNENLPPQIKDGFGYGHGFRSSDAD